MNPAELTITARSLCSDSRGILAADESIGTIKRRFDDYGIENTVENRRRYRELLFTTPSIGQYISGVILYDETLRQGTVAGEAFAALLQRQSIIPGIKVDAGAQPMAGFPGETITEGLDGLATRLKEYYALGARFAKWRAVISIDDARPSRTALESNADLLARYAVLCQAQGIVPIVEPEVLMEGAHTLERSLDVTSAVLATVFERLRSHRVLLEGMILKPNMVLPGVAAAIRVEPASVAAATLLCLRRNVPTAVPGIAFLSGGQGEREATRHLDLMNREAALPWKLTFSYGRALQQSALAAWRGHESGVAAAQQAFATRARLNSLATTGRYTADLEPAAG